MIDRDSRLDGLIVRVSQAFVSSDVFYGHGADSPLNEARLLVFGALQTRTNWTWNRFEDLVHSFVEQRINDRKPVVYLTQEGRYCDRWFITQPGVMIPRSPIFELIQSRFHPWVRRIPLKILDLCCGGGCIGISTALEFPNASLILADNDPKALDCARANIERFQLSSRATVIDSDLCDSISCGQFDLVLSNPPYVSKQEYDSLPMEYQYEPTFGLVSGRDGLDAWRRIISSIPNLMSPDSLLVGEVGGTAVEFRKYFSWLDVIWPELTKASRLTDGSFGVFIAEREALRVSSSYGR